MEIKHILIMILMFGISVLIGFALIKSIKYIESINTPNKINISKSIAIGLFLTPSLTVVPAGSLAGIYVVPASYILFMSLASGNLQYATLLGVLPMIIVSFVAYFILRKRVTSK